MCGIVGVFDIDHKGGNDLTNIGLDLLKGNKNRGQDGYGISVLDDKGNINTYKFQDIHSPEVAKSIENIPNRVIGLLGHARYPTSGGSPSGDEYVQPFSTQTKETGFAFAFNGNIVNAETLAEGIEAGTLLKFPRPILDTRVLQEMILQEIQSGNDDTRRISEEIHNQIDGQCNMALMARDGSFTLSKDRWGFRPVSYIRDRERGLFCFSSESRALFKIGYDEKNIAHLKTGESVKYNVQSKNLIVSDMDLNVPKQKSRCFFETVYFADSKTQLWGEPSNNHRYRLGQQLAMTDSNYFSFDDTIVADVPSSSLYCAKGYAEKLELTHLPSVITKNPDSTRTFISNETSRRDKIKEKYIFNPELKRFIQGKKLVLIDDSMVRGSTLEYLTRKIQDFYEPSEIHIRIPSPPIIGPCYYAINLKHPNELLARKFFQNPNAPIIEELDTLAKYLGATSLKYVNIDQMIQALRVDIQDMCLGCITGKYPTPCGQKEFEKQLQES